MPQFLTTTGCVAWLEDIIRKAKSELYLVSPYLRLDKNFYERLKYANDKGVNIHVVFGKEDLLRDAREFFHGLERASIYYHPDLHAKCYFNEATLLLTSMNLYVSSSREKNREMGLGILKDSGEEVYVEAVEEVLSIISASEVVKGVGDVIDTALPTPPKNLVTLVGDDRPDGESLHGFILETLLREKIEMTLEVSLTPWSRNGEEYASEEIMVTIPNQPPIIFEHRLRISFDHWDDPIKKKLEWHLKVYGGEGRVYGSGRSITVYLPKHMEVDSPHGAKVGAEIFVGYFREVYEYYTSQNSHVTANGS